MNTPHDGYIKCSDCCYKAFNEIPALEAKLSRQSEQLALALKAKNDALHARFLADRTAERLGNEKIRLEAELKRLRPPEPKFRVGQAFVWLATGNLSKVIDRVFENNKWRYRSQYEWSREDEIRALTDEEK